MASIPPSEIKYEEARIHQDKSTTNIIVLSVFTGLAFAFLCARLASRKIQKAGFELDDYLVVVGMIFTIVNVLAGCEQSHWGVGKHLVALQPHELIMQGKWELVNLYSYTTSMTFIKLSMLRFLARVFGMNNKTFRTLVYILSAYVILWAIALYFAYGFQCLPFSRNWSLTNACKAPLTLDYSATILNSVHDLAVIFLPQPIIWRLQLPQKRKIAISAIFFVGLAATIMGLLKIAYINGAPGTGPHKIDVTYNQSVALVFTSMEPILAIICACLPATPAVFHHMGKNKLFSRLTSLLQARLRSSLASSSYQAHPSTLSNTQNQKDEGGSWDRLSESQRGIRKHTDIDVTGSYGRSEEVALEDLKPRGDYAGDARVFV